MKAKSQVWLSGCAWGLAVLYALVAFAAKSSSRLAFFGDGLQFVLMLIVCASFGSHVRRSIGRARWFWALMTLGGLLWLVSQVMWSYYELWRGQMAPSPYIGDVVLFLHMAPMIAGLATVPHDRTPLPRLIALSLGIVAVWWTFLYAFLVIPWQYVQPDAATYGPAFNALYAIENLGIITFLAIYTLRAAGAWRRLYVFLLAGSVVYTVNSQIINRFIQQKDYYTGCPYDLLFIVPVAWIASAAARFEPEKAMRVEEKDATGSSWLAWITIAAVISVPLFLAWNVWSDIAAPVRDFRFLAGLSATALMAVMLFAQQQLLSQARFRSLLAAKTSLAQLAEAREELEHKATHDSMTGCLNRATVVGALERELARATREGTRVAALLIDLDDFKRINDTFGHHAGDLTLVVTSSRMQGCVRRYDYLGRYGGEEFLIIIPDCEPQAAVDLAERIRSRIALEPPSFYGSPLHITASVGIAISGEGEDASSLLRRADVALYASKRQGRNRVELAAAASEA